MASIRIGISQGYIYFIALILSVLWSFEGKDEQGKGQSQTGGLELRKVRLGILKVYFPKNHP
jgi:hypothetical protein